MQYVRDDKRRRPVAQPDAITLTVGFALAFGFPFTLGVAFAITLGFAECDSFAKSKCEPIANADPAGWPGCSARSSNSGCDRIDCA